MEESYEGPQTTTVMKSEVSRVNVSFGKANSYLVLKNSSC